MRLLPAAGHRRMPWKNGGGETFEVAIFPADADVESLDWRVSMAVVATDGAFSAFPEIDRTLVLLEGDGMTLDIAGHAPVSLTSESRPCVFPGDVTVTATLAGSAITDLNVMTARGRYTHDVERFSDPCNLRAGVSETLLLFGEGLLVETVAANITLGRRDVVLLDADDVVRARPADAGCLLVTIRPIA